MKKILLVNIIITILFLPLISQAYLVDPGVVDPYGGAETLAADAGYESQPSSDRLPIVIGSIIQIALSFLGVFFMILIIFSGFQWMSAGGNPETVGKAKSRITNAVIGLAIVLVAYGITWFITGTLTGNIITPPATL